MTSNTRTLSHFAQIPSAEIQRSKFDRSHGVKKTINAGDLIPILCDEILPGDTFHVKDHIFGRLATPITPFMDNLYLDTHYFFVPSRLLWDNWEKFNGAQTNPGDSTDFVVPSMKSPASTGYPHLSIFDNFGIPPAVPNLEHISLPLRAYNLIWNEWYRDQNLQNSVTVHTGDSADPHTDYKILKRGKRKDYFTSALPFPQKGPAVELPLGLSAPVYGEQMTYEGGAVHHGNAWQARTNTGAEKYTTLGWFGGSSINPANIITGTPEADLGNQVSLATQAQIETLQGMGVDVAPPYADLSQATAATINSLRMAFQIQRMYERDARGGTRYVEILKAHFNVTSPDFRLQRPEYLGGNSKRITSSVVPQTSSTDSTTPQANLAAYSVVAQSGNGFNQSFVEHGYVIGLCSLRADLNYQQGLNRMWSRKTRFDFYWPALSHLGEQAILNKEIYAQGELAVNPSTLEPYDDEVFGYQERYAEYRYKPNEIHGAFRSTYAQPLDMWHLAQKFTALPLLNAEFIEENPPVERIIAIEDEPQLIADFWFEYNCVRPMPTYSVPGMVDHF